MRAKLHRNDGISVKVCPHFPLLSSQWVRVSFSALYNNTDSNTYSDDMLRCFGTQKENIIILILNYLLKSR